MNKKRILHWKLVEESKNNTTFEGSLHSKMAKINFDHDFWDLLKYKRNRNNIRRSSAVLDEEVRKDGESIRNYMNIGDDF
ncbi:MAG: hypothetical protein ACFFG0_51965 [Candidatus Thorarchaeota archaeon]